ncbi:L,D-transpeptidase [Chengkuizengella sediminis]|uniref:L,D-transpeptidase n=1 Tax=Chengkuizengella sediminis TaxID=1885917 RepID=UPI003B83A249
MYKIKIDLSDFKLYLYKNGNLIKTYPVAIGAIASATPTGKFTIKNKAPNPGGPYGSYWLGLSKPHYGIHGTNDPSSIGKRVSKGCVRMYNKDVTELANTVSIGTPVTIQK